MYVTNLLLCQIILLHFEPDDLVEHQFDYPF